MKQIDQDFKKSSYSGRGKVPGGECVEVKRTEEAVYVRDSKNPNSRILKFTLAEWQAFIKGVKNKEFDI